jgi:3-hydroxybutyryl-CoA dehydrogenase
VELLEAFGRRIGQVPLVLKKEYPGYVSNAIWGAMNSAAIKIALVDKIASVQDVDRAVMIHLGMPVGPFGLNDHIGLDTIWHVMESGAKISGDAGAQAFADDFKRDYIDKGWLGVKSGRGFYTYPDPEYLRPGFLGSAGSE